MHKKKLIAIAVILVACSTITYVLMGIIPLFQGKEISPHIGYAYYHSSNNGYYRLKVEENQLYMLSLDFSNNDIHPEFQLFSRSSKIVGLQSEPGQIYSYSFNFEFRAKHNGHYFLTISNSQGGIFHLNLWELDSAYNVELTYSYTNAWKLILVIFAGFLIAGSGFIFLQMYMHKSEEERIKKKFTSCPSCGKTCKVEAEYCFTCGYTFVKPKVYKNY